MENCKNCKYCLDETYYVCAVTNCCINFPRLMGGSKKCVCYKKKDKFDYPVLSDLEDYLQKIDENQGDLF